jgi:hypothetical protein
MDPSDTASAQVSLSRIVIQHWSTDGVEKIGFLESLRRTFTGVPPLQYPTWSTIILEPLPLATVTPSQYICC